MVDNLLRCTMCPYRTINQRVLISHYVKSHQFDDRFFVICNVDYCGATYKRWKSYKMHVYRKHRANVNFIIGDFDNVLNEAQYQDEYEEFPLNANNDDGTYITLNKHPNCIIIHLGF